MVGRSIDLYISGWQVYLEVGVKMVWNFRKIVTAKTEKEAKRKFKKGLEQEGFRRWDFKIDSCNNTLQYPETFVIDYRARKKKGRRN